MKTKDELKLESKEKFKIHILATRKDLNCVNQKLNEIDKYTDQAKEVPPEATNVLLGIKRDLLVASENIDRIKRLLNKKI